LLRTTAGEEIELGFGVTFALGACGAFAALLFVQWLPIFQAMMDGDVILDFTRERWIGAGLVALTNLLLGGVVAVILGDVTQAKQALAYGVAWQGTLGSFLQQQVA
jgi:hypothetical protein